MEILSGITLQVWGVLLEAAPYVLLGFFAAGLLKALVPEEVVVRHLGKSSTGSVLKASLFGVPLPLCSCGVIPAAIGLRKQGASKGASASFLVSVPETGADSIAITWALLGPVMALVRPLAAFVTATITGLLINLLPDEGVPVPVEKPAGCCGSTCNSEQAPEQKLPLAQRLRGGMRFAFGDLLGDIGKWLIFGILLAGIISYLVPDDFIERYLGSEFLSLLIMLIVGIPLYICASASTPIAAVLILKGLSPGAALVFLLAGPATNAATLALVLRYFGRPATAIYLATIALCSLLFGFLLNRIFSLIGFDLTSQIVSMGSEASGNAFEVVSAVLLLVLVVYSLLPKKNSTNGCGCN